MAGVHVSKFILPPRTPPPPSLPNPKTLVTSHSRAPSTFSLPDLTSKVSPEKVFSSLSIHPPDTYRKNYSFMSIIHFK